MLSQHGILEGTSHMDIKILKNITNNLSDTVLIKIRDGILNSFSTFLWNAKIIKTYYTFQDRVWKTEGMENKH